MSPNGMDDNAIAVTQDRHFSRICNLQHRLESCTQEETAAVLQEACEDLTREVDVAREDAETIWAWMVRHKYANKKAAHCKSILEIWQPGGRVDHGSKAKVTGENRKRRHLKTIVLEWGAGKSDKYEWHKWGSSTLAALAKIATTLESWDVFVQWANCVMIQRHDIVDHHRGTIGNTWSTSTATASALQPADVLKIADIVRARGKSPVTEQRKQQIAAWVSPCPKLLSADRFKFAFGNKAVQFDEYGLLCRKKDVGGLHKCDEHCMERGANKASMEHFMEREVNKASIDSNEATLRNTQRWIEEKKRRAGQRKHEAKQQANYRLRKTKRVGQLGQKNQAGLDWKKTREQEGASRQQVNRHKPQHHITVPLSGDTTTDLQSGDVLHGQSARKSRSSQRGEAYDGVRGTTATASSCRLTNSLTTATTDATAEIQHPTPKCNDSIHICVKCSGYCKFCTVPKTVSDQVTQEMFALAHTAAKHREAQMPKLDLWLTGLTFAAIHDTSYTGRDRQPSLDAADVVATTAAKFRHWGERGDKLSRPVIIRGDYDSDDYNDNDDEQNEKRHRETFAQILRLPYASKLVSVEVGPGRTPEILPGEDVLERLEEASERETVQPWNLTILGDIHKGHRSSVQGIVRFGLIDQLSLRRDLGNNGHRIAQNLESPRDVQDRQVFQTLSFEGAFSGARLDVLRGTWRNNLFGLQLWWIVPRSLMTEQDWSDLSRDGDSWDPQRKGRAIVLHPGDTLVLNDLVVHASLTVRKSAMTCGSFWDSMDMPALINDLQWLACNPKSTDAPHPLQVSVLLGELLEIAIADSQALPTKYRPTQILDALERYFLDGCGCVRCDERCWCRKRGIRCTSRCFDHPDNWSHPSTSKGKEREDQFVCMAESSPIGHDYRA